MVSVIDNNFGFIITRHVICESTNQYWLYSVKQIRKFYPKNAILIIDDKSNYEYVKITNNCLTQEDLKMCKIIQSEFLGAGECLPFYYFYKYKPFKTAVIIHDSVFLHSRINFESLNGVNVIPLWFFYSDKENMENTKNKRRTTHK